jgi:hypothetical protein
MEQQQRAELERHQRSLEQVQSELPADLAATELLLLPALQPQVTRVAAVAAVAQFPMWRVQEALVVLELSSFVMQSQMCRPLISILPTTPGPTQTTSHQQPH